MNYYNEFDKNAAAWLRELIKLGAIPDGEVDERSITDVRANDLKGFTQCHFFAGIAGWPEALRRAGVPSTRPLWTGSCPCQSFSCAGKQKGFGDPRDLWPAFFNLIRECRPERVFGEQVKNAVRHGWLDRLYADLEGEGYACGSVILGAHSAGADHQRQRIYWLADSSKRGGGTLGEAGEHGSHRANGAGGGGIPDRPADSQHAERRPERPEHTEPHGRDGLGGGGEPCRLADAQSRGQQHFAVPQPAGVQRKEIGATECVLAVGGHGASSGGLADAERDGRNERRPEREGLGGGAAPVGRSAVGGMGDTSTIGPEMRDGVHGELHGQGSGEGRDSGQLADAFGERGCGGQSGREDAGDAGQSGQARNFWSDARPHLCKDGKWRRYEDAIFPLVGRFKPGVQPMADESARGVGHSGDPCAQEYVNNTAEARVMRLKGYGNCICVDTAAMFIQACGEVL